MARTPVANPSDGQRALYFMRRHQGKASSDQLEQFEGITSTTMQKLVPKFVTVISN